MTADNRPYLTAARVEAALSAAVDAFGVSRPALLGRSRAAAVAAARMACYAALREETRGTLVDIAGRLGVRDHTTVISGVRRAEELASTDPTFRAALALVRAAARGEEPRA